eukprot:gene18992-25575_t
MTKPSKPLWNLVGDIMYGRRVKDGEKTGTVKFGPFHDPNREFKVCCAVEWDNSSDVSHIEVKVLRPMLLECFNEDYLPPELVEYQRTGWDVSKHVGDAQLPAVSNHATRPTSLPLSVPASSAPKSKQSLGRKRARPTRSIAQKLKVEAAIEQDASAGQDDDEEETAEDKDGSWTAVLSSDREDGRDDDNDGSKDGIEEVAEEEEASPPAASNSDGEDGSGGIKEESKDASEEVAEDEEASRPTVPNSGSKDGSEDGREEFVVGWTGCRYPKELCCRPGDIAPDDIPQDDMEGDYEVEQVMDEVQIGADTWVLVKWRGFQLRPGLKGGIPKGNSEAK